MAKISIGNAALKGYHAYLSETNMTIFTIVIQSKITHMIIMRL